MFDVSSFLRPDSARIWSVASENLVSLEIGDISSITVTEMLRPNMGFSPSPSHVRPSIFPSIQKLCICVDYITDTMVTMIAKGLMSLTHLDLRDAPLTEPSPVLDLTNTGLQQINQYGRLKHLSLIRSQEYMLTYFRRVNDLGLLLMADNCAEMESICFGGFCRVTDTGFKTIFHSCHKLHKLKVTHGTQLTDLIFHDISATPLSLVHVSLRWCSLLTNNAVASLASNKELKVLDLRCCRNLGDEALRAIGTLPNLKALLLDNSNISDEGLSFLRPRVVGSLVSLSLRGCKELTDDLVSALFEGCSVTELKELDLSNLPSLSDEAAMSLARLRVPLLELRLRKCPHVGDASVMALASMQVDEDRWHGNGLRVLDLYNCGGVTGLSYKWLKRPYFPRLRCLGVTGSSNRNIVDALARNRPFLNVRCHGEEIGAERWDDGPVREYAEEYDELERWLLEGEIETDFDHVDGDDEEIVDVDHDTDEEME